MSREQLLDDFIQEGALLTQLSGRTASIVQARDVGTFTTAEWCVGPLHGARVARWDDPRVDARGGPRSSRAGWAAPLGRCSSDRVARAGGVALDAGAPPWHRASRHQASEHLRHRRRETDEMHVKVLDFGIAKVVQSRSRARLVHQDRRQRDVVHAAYGAPEQFSRSQGATGPWTDIYALALVMTELLIGRPPLEGDDFIQLGMATADPNRRPTPGAFGVATNDALEAVFKKALAVKTTDRHATAGEFWQAVRASQNMPGMSAMSDPSPRSWVEPPGSVRGAATHAGFTALVRNISADCIGEDRARHRALPRRTEHARSGGGTHGHSRAIEGRTGRRHRHWPRGRRCRRLLRDEQGIRSPPAPIASAPPPAPSASAARQSPSSLQKDVPARWRASTGENSSWAATTRTPIPTSARLTR